MVELPAYPTPCPIYRLLRRASHRRHRIEAIIPRAVNYRIFADCEGEIVGVGAKSIDPMAQTQYSKRPDHLGPTFGGATEVEPAATVV